MQNHATALRRIRLVTSTQAAIYARVFSDQQAERYTINSQVEALIAGATADGHESQAELCFLDNGQSGASLIRPALERLRDLAAVAAIDVVYVTLLTVWPARPRISRCWSRSSRVMTPRSCSSTARSGKRPKTPCCCTCNACSWTTGAGASSSVAAAASATWQRPARPACWAGHPTAIASSAVRLRVVWHASRWSRTRPRWSATSSIVSFRSVPAWLWSASGCSTPGNGSRGRGWVMSSYHPSFHGPTKAANLIRPAGLSPEEHRLAQSRGCWPKRRAEMARLVSAGDCRRADVP